MGFMLAYPCCRIFKPKHKKKESKNVRHIQIDDKKR